MNFVWAKNDVATTSVTLYETNITLNKAACEPFEDVRYVMLGYDIDSKQIAIKPISKEELDLDLYPRANLHKISLGKSYGRISNKNFMKEISQRFNLDYQTTNGIKLDAFYDENNQIMLVQL